MLTEAEKKRRIALIAARLAEVYPSAECALEWNGEPWKLLVMGSLSAQCTDARVNEVCRILFSRFPSAAALAAGDPDEVEAIVRPCGLFRVKAKNIRAACRMLVEDYGGVLPSTMEDLLTFPGVGRKVANLLLGDVYHTGGTVTDTHCIRLCGRFGMVPLTEKNPVRIEKIMDSLLPPADRSAFCHRLVFFGRDVCTARAPACSVCPLKDLCDK